MHLVFGKIFSATPDTYVREKLKRIISRNAALAAQYSDDWIEAQVTATLSGQATVSVPIASADSIDQVTPEQEVEIDARKRCALATLLRESPLANGETVQEDFFTFLKQPYGSLPENTAVLRRTTSEAEIFYFFDDVRVVKGDLQFAEHAAAQEDYPPVAALEDYPPVAALLNSIDMKDLAKELGKGLLSGVAGTIGALIFEKIFPPGAPDYFVEILKEIRTIVRQELTEATMAQINGRLNGVVAWSRNTYRPRKADPNVSRKELGGMLTPEVNKIYTDVANTMMEDRFAKYSLGAFMVAAGVHLGLMQEQALVDHVQSNPSLSSYAKSVALNAQEYHDHVVRTFDALLADRHKAVEIRYDPLTDQSPGDPYINVKSRYRWVDTVNQRQGRLHEAFKDADKNYHSGKEQAEADRNNYLTGVTRDFTAALNTPKETARQWLKLKAQPIPAQRISQSM